MNNSNQIAMSIIIAGLIIAGSIFLTRGAGGNVANNNQGGNNQENTASISDFRKLQDDDHVLGNPDAKVTIVEFSDFECPFCSRIHPTLSRIVEEREDVNWVYRHFPLASIHSRATGAAIASECIAELGGNDAFWQFTDNTFNNINQLGQPFYESQAQSLGIDLGEFQTCIASEEASNRVAEDLDEAVASGGRGTPFSIIITTSGDLIPFSGALPYESILTLVDGALEE